MVNLPLLCGSGICTKPCKCILKYPSPTSGTTEQEIRNGSLLFLCPDAGRNGYILHVDLAPIKELVSLQRRCSNNLNQVAVHANTYGVYPEEIDGLRRDYEKLWGRCRRSCGNSPHWWQSKKGGIRSQ